MGIRPPSGSKSHSYTEPTVVDAAASVAEEGAETADLTGQDKRIYARLVELLRDSEHEESDRRIEPMAVPSRKDVYLEAMEEAEDEDS